MVRLPAHTRCRETSNKGPAGEELSVVESACRNAHLPGGNLLSTAFKIPAQNYLTRKCAGAFTM